MNDETSGVASKELVWLKSNMYSFLVMIIVGIKKPKVWIKMLLKI